MSAGRVGRRSVVTVSVDPIACEAYGYCAELLGEVVTLDEWGYPIVDGSPVPAHLVALARKAARDCPRRALLLSEKPRLLSEKPRHRIEG
jgi:ferredoxin